MKCNRPFAIVGHVMNLQLQRPPKSRRICMGKTTLATQSRFFFRGIEKWRMVGITPWDWYHNSTFQERTVEETLDQLKRSVKAQRSKRL